MKEEDRQRTIRTKLARQDVVPRPVMPTGFPALDEALGGGLPRGSVVEIFGLPACGKTTLALQVAAFRQQVGEAAGWIDADHTFDPAYAASLGLVIDGLPLVQPPSAEQAIEIARTLILSGALELLVIDSAAALVPELELEFGLGEGGPGLHGRVLASELRRISAAASRSGTTAIFLNQVRTRVKTAGEEVSAGGPALKLHAAARIELSQVTRAGVHFRIVKNKASRAFGEGQFLWNRGVGFAKTP